MIRWTGLAPWGVEFPFPESEKEALTQELWVGKHGAYVYSVQFTPDGRRAVSSSGDRTARVRSVYLCIS